MEVKKKFNYMNLLLVLVFLIGLGILLYPNISDYFNKKNSSKSITTYDEKVAQMNEEQRREFIEKATIYNEELNANPVGRFAEMDDDLYEEYMNLMNISGDGMMCYLKIDKIGLNAPVYHTTEEEVLQKYIGHVEGTSLPIGGVGTHCGLSGHRGLPSAVLFTNLDRLVVGDTFSIIVLGEEHLYQVDQITTVLPNDMSPLAIDPEQDYVTLITCTPYGENTHRLMVRGVRVPNDDIGNAAPVTEEGKTGLTREQIVNIIAVGMAFIFFFVAVPLLLFPAVPKKKIYLRPWDDKIEEVFRSAIEVSERATRANWEMDEITLAADRLASLRRYDQTMDNPKALSDKDDYREWNEYDYDQEINDSKEKKMRKWDDDILEKVDQDWEVLDRKTNKLILKFLDITNILKTGTVEKPAPDLKDEYKKEMDYGKEIVKKSKEDRDIIFK